MTAEDDRTLFPLDAAHTIRMPTPGGQATVV